MLWQLEDEIRCKLDTISLDKTHLYSIVILLGNQCEYGKVFVDEKKVTIMKSLEFH